MLDYLPVGDIFAACKGHRKRIFDGPIFFFFLEGVYLMALVKFGGGIIQMSGSIAGNTYARNRFGNYVRARTKPINPNTAGQQVIRGLMATLTAVWGQTLTAAQRTAWNLYASSVSMKNALGEAVNLTGFNHYLRSNIAIMQAGGTRVDAGPTIFELPTKDPTLAVTISEATQKLSITFDDAAPWAAAVGNYLIITGGQPQNAQRNFFAGPWKFADTIDGAVAPPASPDANIDAPFAVTEGQRVWVKARIALLDGRLSEEFTANCFCAA